MYSREAQDKVRQSWNLGRFGLNRASTTSGTAIAGSALGLALLSVFLIGALQLAQAQTETLLYSFTGGRDGSSPRGGLIADSQGNLYGATVNGGIKNRICPISCGVVFQLTPAGTENVLFRFDNYGSGWWPNGGLIFDPQGNLFGTTVFAGDLLCSPPLGCGTVFEVSTVGQVQEKTLYAFTGLDGEGPFSGLVRDSNGNLYGTTEFGGAYGHGAVFELTAAGKETVLYSFTGTADGNAPSGLLRDSHGNLYGTTFEGGITNSFCPYGCGVVFKITRASKEKVLYSFTGGAGGQFPQGPLVQDAHGNLYGTTIFGGTTVSYCSSGCGTVFSVTRGGKVKVLHSFAGPVNSDGAFPSGGLFLDAKGNLYGTTSDGGCCGYRYGTVFKVTP